MENEQYLCLLDTNYILSLCSHRTDAETIEWLKTKDKYWAIASLITNNGNEDNRELERMLERARDNWYHKLTS